MCSSTFTVADTFPIGSRDQGCTLEFLRLRAATFEFELERERQRCSETGGSMPQEWVASLERERQEILERIQHHDSQVDESAHSSIDPVQASEPVIHAPVPQPLPPAPALGIALRLEGWGRNSVPLHFHGSGYAHPRPATAHPAIRPSQPTLNVHAPNIDVVSDVTDYAQRSSRSRKREREEKVEHEESARKQLSERTPLSTFSHSSRPIPRPFLLPKSPDAGFASDRVMNTARRHHGTPSSLSLFRPALPPTPLSPPRDIRTLGISGSGRRSARGWYSSTTLRPDQLKENFRRYLVSSQPGADPRQTPRIRSTVADDNEELVFTEDKDPFAHKSPALISSDRRAGVDDYTHPTSATAFASLTTHGQAVEESKSITNPLYIAKICGTLMDVFRDLAKYKKFLSYRDRAAQSLLNFLQTLLDYSQLEDGFRSILFVALLRLARKSDLYPECFALTDVTREGEHPVADGRYGDIYKGYFRGRLVCLKVVRMYEKSNQASLYKAFSREAVLWGQLSHVNVLPFYGVCQLEDARRRISLVSPWMEHGNVNEFLKQNPDADRRLLVVDVAAGMSHLHNHCVTHGDLKGSNILVTESKRACLADFGFSSVIDSQGLKTASLSSAAQEGGTVRFQAPELIDPQFEGSRSQASDIYAFALVCYEIFTGNVPFCDIPNNFTVMLKVTRGERPSRPLGLSYLNLGLNDAMWRLMEDCWEHTPDNRPTASQIIDRLPRVPDNRPRVPWSHIRASAGYGPVGGQDISVVETLRVLETTGISLFQS